MNRNWTPENRVSVTDAGMVIEIELGAVQTLDLNIFVEAEQLCVHGRHHDFGEFEARFGITAQHSLVDARATLVKGILRIVVPIKDKAGFKRREMLICCDGCGKHFDIVITGKGSRDYRCPACGKIQSFDLEAFMNKALEQMPKKKRRRR